MSAPGITLFLFCLCSIAHLLINLSPVLLFKGQVVNNQNISSFNVFLSKKKKDWFGEKKKNNKKKVKQPLHSFRLAARHSFCSHQNDSCVENRQKGGQLDRKG